MPEIWNLSALCRCCHADDGALRSLQTPYVHDGAIEIYAVLLRDTFGLHIDPPTIEASYSICENCIELVRLAYRFKKQVQTCEKKFYEYCENEKTHNLSANVKFEVENDSIIINAGVNVDEEVDDGDDHDGIDDSDGGYSGIDSEFEGTGKNEKEGDKTVYCQFCNELFRTTKAIRDHVRKVHMSDGLSCKICKKTFKNRTLLRKHFPWNHKSIRQCRFCVKVFGSCEERDKHEYDEHVKQTGYVCDECEKSFQCKQSLLHHILWHKRNNEFVCESCGYAFKRQWALNVHIDTVHGNIRRFQCFQCGKAYKSKKSLMLHGYSHTGEVPFKCETCSKGFKTKTDLRYHVENIHHVVDAKIVGLKPVVGDDDDENHGSDDSDGGYRNNDLENESEDEIDKEKKIEVEVIPGDITEPMKSGNEMEPMATRDKTEPMATGFEMEPMETGGKMEPTRGPPVEEIKLEQFSYDSPDESGNRNNDLECDSEAEIDNSVCDDVSGEVKVDVEEFKGDKNREVKAKAKTAELAEKGKKKTKRRIVNMTDYYDIRFICHFCQKHFKSDKKLQKHYNDKHVPEDFTCPLCHYTARKRSGFMKHLMLIHEKPTFYCQFCIETFKTLKDMRRHQVVHIQNGYTCDTCQKKFKTKRLLIRHVYLHLGTMQQHMCETCGRCFNLASNLKAHVQVVHEKKRPFPCDLCDKSFALKKQLARHIRMHTGERPFICDICTKSYTSKDELTSHRRKHIEEKCEQCDVCGKNYTKANIKIHMNIHTKPFKCELCGLGFGQKNLLQRHQKKYTNCEGKEKLICKICNKSYYNWEIHKRIHIKRPFNCHLCYKFYEQKTTLDRHLEVKHYKERKHCDVCNKTFSSWDSVKNHQQSMHNNDKEKSQRTYGRVRKKKLNDQIKDTMLPIVKVERIVPEILS